MPAMQAFSQTVSTNMKSHEVILNIVALSAMIPNLAVAVTT